MLRPALLSTTLLVGLALAAFAGEGQGPGDTSRSTIDQVSLGEHWYGKKIDLGDLKGKVVLMAIWGS